MVSVENTFAFPFYAGNTSPNLDSELSQGNTFLTHTRFQPSFLLLIGNTSALPSLLASKVGNTNAFPMFFRIFPGNTPVCPRKSLFPSRVQFLWSVQKGPCKFLLERLASRFHGCLEQRYHQFLVVPCGICSRSCLSRSFAFRLLRWHSFLSSGSHQR